MLVEYTARLKDSGKVIDTTDQNVATANSLYEPGVRYIPRLVSVGDVNYIVQSGLLEGLVEMSVGESKEIEVPPEKAWGKRDRKKVRAYSHRKLGKDADRYSVGDEVEIDGKKGTIRYMSSGRVQVDFNHPYSDMTIIYDAKVTHKLEKSEDIIREILNTRLNIEKAKIKLDSSSLSIVLSEDDLRLEDFANLKRRVIQDIFKFVPAMDIIRFVEEHVNKTRARQTTAEAAGSSDSFSGLDDEDDDNMDDDLDIDDDDDLDDDDDDLDDDDDDLDVDDDDLDDNDLDVDDDDNKEDAPSTPPISKTQPGF